MSPINKTSLASVTLSIVLLLSLFFLAGCGDKNEQSDLDPVSGQHAAGWVPTGHKTEAKAHMETCSPCHGADFGGGISKVACTQCHLGNQLSVHPNQWGPYAYGLHGSYVKVNDPSAAKCANANCHGANLDGIGGTGPSCALCHIDGNKFSAHPPGWNTRADLLSPVPKHAAYFASNGVSTCRNIVCHGQNLQGVFLSGLSCNVCHTF
jgi:hypothetical protein